MVDAQHHQPRVEVVGHVLPGLRQRMDAAEVARLAQVGSQALVQLLHHLVGIALELLGAVLRQLGDRGLGRVPVARAVLVEVGGRSGQPPQGIAEDRGRLARHHAAELHPPVLDAPMGRRGRGRRAQVDRARHAPAGRELAEVGHLAVQPQRQRVGAVHVLLDHRHPVVREVARQLELHARVVDRDVRRQDERVPVPLLPQAVDHRRHQAQHAARALELHQRGPVGVEPVEDLRVDRVGRLDALLVVGVAALGRELLRAASGRSRRRPAPPRRGP